ncbi:MAG: adenylosuccinate synthase [Armatimonadota bacterium]|nr:adenylosuccinate synthase [Armatimonadota bacterium]MDR7403804.1 adenylosuccinate synthase [Armatimonadota bacterium]
MPVIAVVGGQWGDEGKGKVVDALAERAHMVVRYNGGDNAGHTLVGPQGVLRLHLVPSGICHPHVACVIGPGVVVNPDVLREEIALLNSRGISTDQLRLDRRAHLIFPHHREQDEVAEVARGSRALGTTRRGIGPAYADAAARSGIRVGDLLEPEFLWERLGEAARRAGTLVGRTITPGELLDLCEQWRERLRPYIADTHPLIQEALRRDDVIILEGQLGVMRDLTWGTYPYVTSSTCLPGGACAGAGVPAARIGRVIGVVKAYTTAVGAGPLPSEVSGVLADVLRERGEEYGVTTGRPRRCGWFDAVAARFAAEVAGFTELAVMKMDVLDGLRAVRICVGYRDGGTVWRTVPPTPVLARVQPVYEEMEGWDGVARARTAADLPAAARAFLRRLEDLVGVPVTMVGVGRERDALVSLAPVGSRGGAL